MQNFSRLVLIKAVSHFVLVIKINGIGQRFTRISILGKNYSNGFLKDLVIGPLPVNIYFIKFFYFTGSTEVCTEVCNFADDTTFFVCDKELNSLIKRLGHRSLLAIECF